MFPVQNNDHYELQKTTFEIISTGLLEFESKKRCLNLNVIKIATETVKNYCV